MSPKTALIEAAMSADEHWVFGYGSLIWRPGFAFAASQRALLRGAHRSLCIYSHYYRGTEAAGSAAWNEAVLLLLLMLLNRRH